ncbi:MAG: VapC toxin family PIN domain ribonuclease [Chloroflexi bacterium CG07_land_8_20_14_0_80_45_17]|nr:MAG: VapC toxin family PIN domain ribonuclease [Chloroflexi bacterium CG23_combo_of_CG06-09_8_20_14_all_45_10]PIU56336.1 MAG: VapC toxin family PIN domain ribonuclease [Chloroflexi bacterium CG07_land_8_20_14_0_80_45_17]
MTYVLDTNIITAILKGNEKVKRRAQEVIVEGEDIFINGISYYEIKRGLLAKNATAQLEKFDRLCERFGLILLGTQAIFDEAAQMYAVLQLRGEPIEDADILIASLVKVGDFILVSDDTDFHRIQGLWIENWLT